MDRPVREDILINVLPFETRVALLQDGAVAEIHLERSRGSRVTGNIYRGRVARVLPGLQAAFVDIGLERPGFLHLGDIAGAPENGSIRDVLAEDQVVLVQIVKDPIATKGARLTTALSIPSRYLVLMLDSEHLGVSQRIESEPERERLRDIVQGVTAERTMPEQAGVIVRTAAEGRSREEIGADLGFLLRVWERVQRSLEQGGSGLIYEDLPVHIQVVRDLVGASLASVQIDDSATYQRVIRFTERFAPELRERVELYRGALGLFEQHKVDEQIDGALTPRASLKCGGYLIIEQTEAMVTIDVNTGANVGRRNEVKGLEETVYRTNLEAAAAIPRQLRLRNLGGIIIVDFIDMASEEHRRDVLRVLEKGFEADRATTRVAPFSSLGLVEISRKRTRESLARQVGRACSECSGTGVVKSAESTCYDIFRSLLRDARQRDNVASAQRAYVIRACEAVVDRLLDEDAASVDDIRALTGLPVRLELEPSYGLGQFDVVLAEDVGR